MQTWEDLSEVEQAQTIYSDIYKDAYGFRPRHATTEQWNDVEWLNTQITECVSLVEKQIEQERLLEQENIQTFEASINKLILAGAKCRETAIKWLHDAHNTHGDNDYLCFELGVPYGYIC